MVSVVMRGSNRRLLDESQESPARPASNGTQAGTDEPRVSPDREPVQFDSSSMAVTVLVLLSALFFLGFFSVYARRFFASNYHDAGEPHQRPRRAQLPPYRGWPALSSSSSAAGLDPLAVRALPLLSYSGSGKEQDGCVVCLSAFEEKETVRAIPSCGHVFHPCCIDSWLICHGSCPLCRSTELFGMSSQWEVRVGVGDVGDDDGAGSGNGADAELERARETDAHVRIPAEGGGSGQERREVRNELARLGRSDSWRLPPDRGPSIISRSHSF